MVSGVGRPHAWDHSTYWVGVEGNSCDLTPQHYLSQSTKILVDLVGLVGLASFLLDKRTPKTY